MEVIWLVLWIMISGNVSIIEKVPTASAEECDIAGRAFIGSERHTWATTRGYLCVRGRIPSLDRKTIR